MSRWQGKPLDEVEALMADYDDELDTLGEYDYLDTAVQRVLELVEEDEERD